MTLEEALEAIERAIAEGVRPGENRFPDLMRRASLAAPDHTVWGALEAGDGESVMRVSCRHADHPPAGPGGRVGTVTVVLQNDCDVKVEGGPNWPTK